MLKQCSASVGSHIFTATYIGRCVCQTRSTLTPYSSRESSKPRQQLSSSQALTQRSPLSPPPRASTMQGSCMEMYLYTATPQRREVTCNPITSQRETRRRSSLAANGNGSPAQRGMFFLCLFQQNRTCIASLGSSCYLGPFHVAHEPVCQHTYTTTRTLISGCFFWPRIS